MSVRALHGHVAIRYWIWRVRGDEDDARARAGPSILMFPSERGSAYPQGSWDEGQSPQLPTRIVVRFHGVECFLYNRTSAYDDIIRRMQAQQKEEEEEGGQGKAGDGRPAGSSSAAAHSRDASTPSASSGSRACSLPRHCLGAKTHVV